MVKKYFGIVLLLLATFSFVPTASAMFLGSLNGSVWSELSPMTGGLGGGKFALQGVKISLVSGGCSTDCPTAITDVNGHYNISGLRPGNYVVKATTINGQAATVGTFNVTAGAGTLNVTVSSTGLTVASGTTVTAATTTAATTTAAAATTGAVSATTAGIVTGTAAVGLGVSEATNGNSHSISAH